MTLLWTSDANTAERYNVAVGGGIERWETQAAMIRALDDSPAASLPCSRARRPRSLPRTT